MVQSKAVKAFKGTLRKRKGKVSFRSYAELRSLIPENRRMTNEEISLMLELCSKRKEVVVNTCDGVTTVKLCM